MQVLIEVNLLKRLLDDDVVLLLLRNYVILHHLEFGFVGVRVQQRYALAVMRQQVVFVKLLLRLDVHGLGFSEHVAVITAFLLLFNGRVRCQVGRTLVYRMSNESATGRHIHALLLVGLRSLIDGHAATATQAEGVGALKVSRIAILRCKC